MGHPLFHVDAFTDRPFAGNPAAVCLLPAPRDAAWMQRVAAEMNLAETAFLHRSEDGYQLRWFTPAVEVPLCGHATLASAHVLWQEGHLGAETARFHTKSGLLTAERRGELIEMNFPSSPPARAEAPADLLRGLGISPEWVGDTALKYFVVLASEAEVRNLQPDFPTLRRLKGRGIVVTAPGTDGFDFISRFFAPSLGVDEDPVTGSAHCCLAPYWATRLGKNELIGYQASSRGGVVRVRTAGDRVHLSGHAVTVLRGELTA